MKTSLIYFTKTGHSKKIADAVAAELKIQPENIKDSPDLTGVDLLFIVGGIYGGKSDPGMIEFVKKLDGSKVKKAVLLTSCLSKRSKQDKVREELAQNGIEVISDEFICRGSFLLFGLKHPNRADLESAVAFASGVAEKEAV